MVYFRQSGAGADDIGVTYARHVANAGDRFAQVDIRRVLLFVLSAERGLTMARSLKSSVRYLAVVAKPGVEVRPYWSTTTG